MNPFVVLWHFSIRVLRDYPNSISSNWLGIIVPLVPYFLVLALDSSRRGWNRVVPKWDLKSKILVSVYALLLAWVVVRDVYQDHQGLSTKNHQLASQLYRQNRGITSEDPAYIGLVQILRQFQGYGSAIQGKPCTIVFTAEPDSVDVAQAIAETSALVSKCNTVAPNPPELPDFISNKEEGTVPGAIVVHASRENRAAISFQRGLGNLLPTRYSYVPPKNPSFAMTDNVMWLQFGSGGGLETNKMKYKYHEGPKADENFENLVRAVFRTSKGCGSQETSQG